MPKKRKSSGGSSRSARHSLPNAELDVLACLWREDQATARRIREMMLKYRPMAHGSVMTLLTRLETKGFVTRQKGPVGKAFIYRAKERPDTTTKRLAGDLLHRVFAGDLVATVAALLDSKRPGKSEADKIKSLLSGRKSK